MTGLSVSPDIPAGVDTLGKAISELQSGITVTDDAISGTLKYVTDYTGFSGTASEQSGNYLALYINVPNTTGVTYTVELVGGNHGPVTLDSDQTIILQIASTSQKVKVTASKSGEPDVVKTYSLTGLTLNQS